MGQLQLAVFGSPEIFHEGKRLTFALRKAQALLLYLAVEGGMHSRGKLASFLWPDSEPHDGRTALRNALALLRRLLAHPDSVPPLPDHLLTQRDLIGLDLQASLTLDQTTVLHVYQQAQMFATASPEAQRTSFIVDLQQAISLIRGPFLDGFWLGEEAPFDEWLRQQQQQWEVRLQLLFDRLSSLQDAAGEAEQAKLTLTRWLGLDPLQEEASRRLMRVHMTLGDPGAALQTYVACRTRLAEELQVKPSPETVALAERVRAAMTQHSSPSVAHPAALPGGNQPSHEVISPLVGRSSAFSQLVSHYQQARQGYPQSVVVEGEIGIGKTRLATEFAAWAKAQGAEVLIGHAMETGGRLPYQSLIEAIRSRLEEENARSDLPEDLWLAELSRLLPELRVHYPDLPIPAEEDLGDRLYLFEAVAHLLDAWEQRGPLILLLDDAQWLDRASINLMHYLARHWKKQNTRVLVLATIRTGEVTISPYYSEALANARSGREISYSQIALQTLNQMETLQLVDAIIDEQEKDTGSDGKKVNCAPLAVEQETPAMQERPQVILARFLFAQTEGHPLYLMEIIKLLVDRQWLTPKRAPDGVRRFELTMEMAEAFMQEQTQRELLPFSVRAMILARLTKLTPPARHLVMAAAVLGNRATATFLWQLTDLKDLAGIEALEEALRSGLLRETETRRSLPGSYHFSHEVERDVIYTELGEARRYLLHRRTLEILTHRGAKAAELAYHAREAGEIEAAYLYNIQAGDEALTVFAVEEAIAQYEQARRLLQEDIERQVRWDHIDFSHEHLYVSLGQAYVFLQAEEQALETYEELLTYARQQQNVALISMTLNRLAILMVHHSFLEPRVRVLLDEAVQTAATSQNQWVQVETAWNLAQILFFTENDFTRSLVQAEHALELARSMEYRELEAKCLYLLGFVQLWRGGFREAIHSFEGSLQIYTTLSNDLAATRKPSLPSLVLGDFPLSQAWMNRVAEALCWGYLAFAQLHDGQVQQSIYNGRKPLTIFKESKNAWARFDSTNWLGYELLESGSYEEALELIQQTNGMTETTEYTYLTQTRFCNHRFALGSIYQAMQQWEEAQAILEEGVAVAEGAIPDFLCIPPLSRLCMHYALRGQWEQAYHYAMKAFSLRKRHREAFVPLDFFRHYETEALLRRGEERLAREEVQRLGEHPGLYRRFRIPYLQSLAVLAIWDGQKEQAIDHLREAVQLAADIGLPAEHWQMLATLGELYEASGQQAQADTAFREATHLLQDVVQGIRDDALCARFLAEPSIQKVLQHNREAASQITMIEVADPEA